MPDTRPSPGSIVGSSSRARSRQTPRSLVLLLALLLIPRLTFMALTPADLGSADLRAWQTVVDYLQAGHNPYAATVENPEARRFGVVGKLNWPPFWLQVLYGLEKGASLTDTPLTVWIKLFLVAVESLLVCVLYLFMRRYLGIEKAFLYLALGVCLNPAAILQPVLHCNFDVLVGTWITFFLIALSLFRDRRQEGHWLLATLFLGVAILTKTAPIALVPLVFYRLRSISRPGVGVGFFLLLAPVSIALSVVYVLGPEAVTRHVLQYRSSPGWFGISGLLWLLNLRFLLSVSAGIFQVALIGGLIYAGVFVFRRDSLKLAELLGIAILFLVSIPTLGPGYAPQYLYWFLPLLCVYYHFAGAPARKLLVVLLTCLAVTYTVEYALFPSHGRFLLHFVPSNELARLGVELSQRGYQTMIRLPLFVAYLSLLVAVFLDLKTGRLRRAGETGCPGRGDAPSGGAPVG